MYERLPVGIPYAVRDPASRGNKSKQIPDAWRSPNDDGYFRDDNSLVKELPRSLIVSDPRRGPYDGARIGTGFVAAHVWRVLEDGSLSARNPTTYSFVPNLVWLPADIAGLTDREGSFAQLYVQATALKIYRDHPVAAPLQPLVEQIWSTLPHPVGIPEQGLPGRDGLNFFLPTATWLEGRLRKIRHVIESLERSLSGKEVHGKVISTRYTDGIGAIKPSAAAALLETLRSLVDA